MKKLIFKILFFGVIICLFCECFRYEDTFEHFYVEQEIKDYCLFNEGSYWIYEDSITQDKDSILLLNVLHVSDTTRGRGMKGVHQYKIYEKYILKFQFKKEDTIIISSGWTEGTNVCLGHHIVYDSIIADYYIINKYNKIIYSFNTYNDDGDFLEEYTNGDLIFKDVKKFNYRDLIEATTIYQDSSYYCSISLDVSSYWAKNIGLIRLEIQYDRYGFLQKKIINLKKYNVSQ